MSTDFLLLSWDVWDPQGIDFIGSPGNQTAWLGTAGNEVRWDVNVAANDRSPFEWAVLVNGTVVGGGQGLGSPGTGPGLDVAWPADGLWLGDYNFTYVLVDARGQREQDTTTLHVANQAPVVAIAPATSQPGDCPAGTCTFDVTFADPGFDPAAGVRCTLLVGGKAMQAVATNASNGSIRFRVGLFFGRQEVSVRADDGLGGVATASIFVTFTPENVIIFQIAVAAIVTASIILVAIAAFVTRWKARAALTSRP